MSDKNANSARLVKTLSNVLGVEVSVVNDESSMDTVPAWTSLSHLNLVIAIEEEFKISFSEQETVEIISVPLIKAVLAEHGIVC